MTDIDRIKELEDGLSKIYEVVAEVSVDTHHPQPDRTWTALLVADGSEILKEALQNVIEHDETTAYVQNICYAAIRAYDNICPLCRRDRDTNGRCMCRGNNIGYIPVDKK